MNVSAALSLLLLDSIKLVDCSVEADVPWLGFGLVSQIVWLRIPDELIYVMLELINKGSVSVSISLSSIGVNIILS